MDIVKSNIIKAEKIAIELFNEVETRNLIIAGKDEKTLNKEVFDLAKQLFGIEKHWHKRIVRCGENTLHPYKENPPNKTIQKNDILFFDFWTNYRKLGSRFRTDLCNWRRQFETKTKR